MKLNVEQKIKVESNMGLVGKVIKDKVHNINDIPGYTYDDLFQIGCIGLCKAAATDKGGTFSTYAYRLIWNEICDALIYASQKHSKEDATEDVRLISAEEYKNNPYDKIEIYDLIEKAKSSAPPSTALGINALVLSVKGYTAKDIGECFGKTTNTITALMSKARMYLCKIPEFYSYYTA